jgi:superfamily II DNA or RNA helicase
MANTDFFRKHAGNLSIGLTGAGDDSLRDAQRGAIWALGAHWTSGDGPAQVVLPTGVGKTLVLTAAPFIARAKRVLVVAPSRVVREQLFDAFATLHGLRTHEAFDYDAGEPNVMVIKGKAKAETWVKALDADVVVATVHGVSETFANVVPPDAHLFDLVLVDEGHHAPAEAWRTLLEACQAPMVFVTATPFRRDRRRIPGEIVYSYPLDRAIAAGVYVPVGFHPVELAPGEDKDRALAEAAAARLKDEAHIEAGSRLIARAGRVEHAEALTDLYKEVGLSLGLVVAQTRWPALQKIFSAVRLGNLDGIVCVGSLTEGFDMPELRIAAYHEPHKTLAPTLQFIGRLSRPGLAAKPELLAVPDDVDEETDILYREDRSWQQLLPDLVDGLIEEERQVRGFVNQGTWEPASLRIPPLALRPGRSARIYRADPGQIDLDVTPAKLGGADVVWRFHSHDADLLALVTQHPQRPRWLDDEVLDAWTFELHVACLITERGKLFIASDVSPCLRDLKEQIGATVVPPIDAEALRRLAWQIAPDAWFSIGMRPTRMTGAAYEQTAGPRVENAVTEDRLRGRSLGHGMAGGGGHGTFGFSVQKAKIWEPESTESLLEFRRWCEQRAGDLDSAAKDTRGLPRMPSVTVATQFDAFPDARILIALMEHTLIQGTVPIKLNGAEVHAHELELIAERISATEMKLSLARDDESLWSGVQHASGTFEDGDGALITADPRTGEVTTIAETFAAYPPILLFTDGSAVQGRLLDRPASPHRPVEPSLLSAQSWAGTDIRAEAKEPQAGLVNLHTKMRELLEAQCEVILTDHGAGELCDLIGLAGLDQEQLAISFIHCKAAKSDTPRRQLADINEVLSQAARSARWTDPAAGLWAELRGRQARRTTYFKVLHDPGERMPALLEQFASDPPATNATIFAVQPGLDTKQVPGWTEGESLINVTADWCRHGRAAFRLIGS